LLGMQKPAEDHYLQCIFVKIRLPNKPRTTCERIVGGNPIDERRLMAKPVPNP
jgi:hypothetical protein